MESSLKIEPFMGMAARLDSAPNQPIIPSHIAIVARRVQNLSILDFRFWILDCKEI
jgi:hypothetical protein